MYLGIDADQASLTKSLLAGTTKGGVYFHNLESDRLEQWVVDHWETVGQTFLMGERDASGKLPLAPRPAGAAFGGGSVVAVGGPVGGGGIVGPVPGPTFVTGNDFTGSTSPITLNGGDPPDTIAHIQNIQVPIGAVGFLSIPLETTPTGVIALTLDILGDATVVKSLDVTAVQMQGLSVGPGGAFDIDSGDLVGKSDLFLRLTAVGAGSVDYIYWNGSALGLFGGF